MGEREATFEHFQQGGNSAAFGGWLNYKFEPDKPTFAEMGVAEWEWIKRQTRCQPKDKSRRLWAMTFSPTQQALRMDVGLYLWTVNFRRDRELALYGLPEPAWEVDNENSTQIHYLCNPARKRYAVDKDDETHWSPVLFAQICMGTEEQWILSIKTSPTDDTGNRENWNMAAIRTGVPETSLEIVEEVSQASAEEFSADMDGQDQEELVVVHPNGALCTSGTFGCGLLFPVRFEAKRATSGGVEANRRLVLPAKLPLGVPVPSEAREFWSPLVRVRPQGAVSAALGGIVPWNDAAVQIGLRNLMEAESKGVLETEVERSRRQLWEDTFRAHTEFSRALEAYYDG